EQRTSQTTQPTTQTDEIESSNRFSLTTSVDKSKFQIGEPVVIHLKIEARAEGIGLYNDGPSLYPSFDIMAPNHQRAEILLSPDMSYFPTGDRFIVVLSPGRFRTQSVVLNKIVDMSREGTYTIAFSVPIRTPVTPGDDQFQNWNSLKSNK